MSTNTLRPHITPLAVGDAAPDFTLTDQSRAEWKLADAVKKGDVVLAFFPLAFTGVCSTEMKCVTDDMAKWQAKGATVVGISCDSFASLKAWADANGYKHTLLSDIHRDVCKAYGLYWADLNVATRGTIVIGKDPSGQGKIKWIQAREPGKAMAFDEVLASVS